MDRRICQKNKRRVSRGHGTLTDCIGLGTEVRQAHFAEGGAASNDGVREQLGLTVVDGSVRPREDKTKIYRLWQTLVRGGRGGVDAQAPGAARSRGSTPSAPRTRDCQAPGRRRPRCCGHRDWRCGPMVEAIVEKPVGHNNQSWLPVPNGARRGIISFSLSPPPSSSNPGDFLGRVNCWLKQQSMGDVTRLGIEMGYEDLSFCCRGLCSSAQAATA